MTGRPSKPRLLLFAFGDFAFNLFWQSIMLFLLFYYTDALAIPIGIAATTYMVASIWDGLASFAAGALVDRRRDGVRYGPLIVVGAVPLGLTFVLAYLPPLATGAWAIGSIFVAHLLFRTAYAGVNVPYLAMSARISPDGGDRAFVAGMRMLFGTAAAVTVALGTVPIGRWLTGSSAAGAYFGAAIVFAGIGALILILVGATYREGTQPERPHAEQPWRGVVEPGAQPRLRRAQRGDDGDDRRHHRAQQVGALLFQISAGRSRGGAARIGVDGAGERNRDPAVDADRPPCRACARCG